MANARREGRSLTLLALLMAMVVLAGAAMIGSFAVSDALGDMEKDSVATLGQIKGVLDGVANRSIDHVSSLAYLEPQMRRAADMGGHAALEIASEAFLTLLSRNPNYLQMRWLELDGSERLRLNQVKPGLIERVPDEALQHKDERPYVQAIAALDRGQIYLSPLDLNMEHGEVERPFVPTIRIGARVYNSLGLPNGMLVLNLKVAGELALLDTMGVGRVIELLNRDGHWLYSAEPGKPWGFVFGKQDSFATLHPQVWAQMDALPKGESWTAEGYWAWESLHPATSDKTVVTDVAWTLVASLPASRLRAVKTRIWLRTAAGTVALIVLIFAAFSKLADEVKRREDAEAGFRLKALELDATNQDLLSQVAERKAAEEELERTLGAIKAREASLLSMLEAAPVAVRVARATSHEVLFVNDRYCQLVSLDRDDVMGTDVSRLYPQRSDFEQIRHELDTSGIAPERLVQITDPNHPERPSMWVMGTYLNVEFGGELCVLGWLYDVTHMHEAQEAERKANLAKSQFLANMSHEIRTPLNAIVGMAYLMNFTALDEDQKRQLDTIQTAGKNLLELLNAILDMSKIEAGEFTFETEPFSMAAVLAEVSTMLKPIAGLKHLSLTMAPLPPAMPDVVEGDGPRIRQMLVNLVNNAIKFTVEGGVTVSLTAAAAQAGGLAARVTVTDTGVGIEADALARLFKPFSQVDDSNTRRQGGTGLGLSIVKQFAERMGGGVGVESVPGRGSSFWFEIPLIASSRTLASLDGVEGIRRLNVLVADDDAVDRELIVGLCDKFGWETRTVTGGQELEGAVVEAASAGQGFDCLVVDWLMPDLDGAAALEHLGHRLGAENLPSVVMISARSPAELNPLLEFPWCDSVLPKPVDASLLFNAVSESVLKHGRDSGHVLDSTYIEAHDALWLDGVRALVVDDSEMNRDVCSRILAHEGALFVTCASGAEALDVLATSGDAFDVVLLDIQMPDMDGLTVAARVRSDLGLTDIPLLALTAGVTVADRTAAMEAGMDDFLAKPIDPRALVRRIRRHIERYQGRIISVVARTEPDEPKSRFPQVPGIRTDDVAKRLQHDEALFLKLLGQFAQEHRDAVCRLEALLAQPDRAEAGAYLHRLRGQSGNLSAMALFEASRALEAAVAQGQADTAALMRTFSQHMSALIAGIDACVGAEASPVAASPASKVDLPALLEAIDALRAKLNQSAFSAQDDNEAIRAALAGTDLAEAYRAVDAEVAKLSFRTALTALDAFEATVAGIDPSQGASP